jgi:hypothetical protein
MDYDAVDMSPGGLACIIKASSGQQQCPMVDALERLDSLGRTGIRKAPA